MRTVRSACRSTSVCEVGTLFTEGGRQGHRGGQKPLKLLNIAATMPQWMGRIYGLEEKEVIAALKWKWRGVATH